jgi:hypothetical protein
MRVAVFGFFSAFAVTALPLAANAVPTGPTLPAGRFQPVRRVDCWRLQAGVASGSRALYPVGVIGSRRIACLVTTGGPELNAPGVALEPSCRG